ncbi:MAG: hypothetical protein HKN16_06715, partial [Saprospiraceae bacterium]|nr:hypothetical protein [Saprospiraceae bacterium]
MFIILFSFFSNIGFGQTTILTAPGASYNDSDGPTGPDIYSVDISCCSSVSFSFDYAFSLPWEGDGNMEYCDEISSSGQPSCFTTGSLCACDPSTPLAGSCNGCWDFLWAQFFLDGSNVGSELIGDSGTTNAEQVGTITSGPLCTNGATNASMEFVTQTWASEETASFFNIAIICWQAVPSVVTNDPICGSENLTLDGSACDNGDVVSWQWTNTGTGVINNPAGQNTFATGAQNGEMYTLTTTDINGCSDTETVSVVVNPGPTTVPGVTLTECDEGGGSATFDLTSANAAVSGGVGTVAWFTDLAGTIPAVPATSFSATNGTIVYAQVTFAGCSALEPVTLIVDPLITVNAGPDQSSCGNATVSLAATTTPVGTPILWTTPGDGTFGNPNSPITGYVPGLGDIAAGFVVLTITPTGGGSCVGPPDQLTITIGDPPTADAGGPYT